MEKLVKSGHLKRYIKEVYNTVESGLTGNIFATGAVTLSEPRPVINYIMGGLSDDQYQLNLQQKKILRASTIKSRVNAIHMVGGREEIGPIDGPISFPFVNPNKIIVLHNDALVLTLCSSDFDVHMVLVDPGSVADLLQLLAFNQMRLSLGVLNLAGRILSGFNGATTITAGDVTLPVRADPITLQVLFSFVRDLGPCKAIMGRA